MSASDIVKKIETLVEGVATIQKLTGVGGDKLGEAMTAISLVCEGIFEALTDKTTPDVVLAQFKAHQEALATGDAAARAAFDAKFKGA